jgi:hypothetical protein
MKSQRDFYTGLIYMGAGVAFAWGATAYNVGNAARMGPGYFPMMLGILLAILGVVIMFKSMAVETADGEKIGSWAWKPLFFIIAANLVFGVLMGGLPSIKLSAMGMMAAIYVLTFIASLAGEEYRWKEILILATVLAVMSYLAFIVLLKLQLQAWPTFLTD